MDMQAQIGCNGVYLEQICLGGNTPGEGTRFRRAHEPSPLPLQLVDGKRSAGHVLALR
jgi:hypothetical protein